ncbi:hypothetical protein B9T12_08985 [Wohlfahrtiimonas chitiniclastica]|uniref:hypothetical protein n=1 Tax=Wohlfahrtiimonas chitiniclastica TaxID=400946 RepID=UPI000B9873D1|nr:hypothetical protein [Wohlfahrtiimonas chitiniclastica]OYQ77097.1 hypothetical protein B9T12_08985 [Wohlfahrtiimonas chitiniclastica]
MTDKNSILSNRYAWLEKIVSESDVKIEQVEKILQKYDIRAQSTLPKAKKIEIKTIRFEGEKQGTQKDGNFSFEWMGLSSGLWGVISDQNLRGKSSVLNICHAVLQGDFPGRIQDDVWFWISNLEVHFSIDNIDYRLVLKKKSGEHQIKEVNAILFRNIHEKSSILYEGIVGDELKEVVANLFMSELHFDNFYAFNKDHNTRKTHGWSVISSALFISQESSALFGNHTIDGLPLRLLQLFIGLPWVSTYTAINVALKQLGQTTKKLKNTSQDNTTSNYLKNELEKLEQEKLDLEKRKLIVVDRPLVRENLVKFDGEFVALQKELHSKRGTVIKYEEELSFINDGLIDVRRTLQQLKDEQASGYLFRKLRPECCPACEANVTIDDENSEHEEGTCALCGKIENQDSELFDERLKITQKAIDEFTHLKNKLEDEIQDIYIEIRELENNNNKIQEVIGESQSQLEDQDGINVEKDLISINAKIDTLVSLMNQEFPSEDLADDISENLDLRVLKIAEKVTKSAFEELQQKILNDVSEILTEYAQNLGIVNIKRAELNTRGHLHIEKGGTSTTFSKLSAGEKLRIRIAIALAVIDIAKKRGYGRHPSLLILDSPASEEMSSDDFGALLASLQRIVQDKNDLQIIVGAVAQEKLLSAIDEDNLKYAKGKDYLF